MSPADTNVMERLQEASALKISVRSDSNFEWDV